MRVMDRNQRLLEKIKTRFNLNDTPKLYTSACIESRMTIGLFHPVIVLPEKLLTVISREECLCILSHESAHVKHDDNLAGLESPLNEKNQPDLTPKYRHPDKGYAKGNDTRLGRVHIEPFHG